MTQRSIFPHLVVLKKGAEHRRSEARGGGFSRRKNHRIMMVKPGSGPEDEDSGFMDWLVVTGTME